MSVYSDVCGLWIPVGLYLAIVEVWADPDTGGYLGFCLKNASDTSDHPELGTGYGIHVGTSGDQRLSGLYYVPVVGTSMHIVMTAMQDCQNTLKISGVIRVLKLR